MNNKKDNMRWEQKAGVLFFAIFSIMNYPVRSFVGDSPMLEWMCGAFIALSGISHVIGLLPEPTYHRLKALKRKLFRRQ